MTTQHQVVINGKKMFDLWRNGWWIGMAQGETVEEARKFVVDSGLKDPNKIVMVPFYGCGTTVQAYEQFIMLEDVDLVKPKTTDAWSKARDAAA